MSEKYDLIVIGAGNGGLMTACRASRMGLKTLVLERHNLPGGAATSFVRGRFEFDASLHEIPDFGEGESRGELGRLFDELGIKVEMLQVKDAFRYIIQKNGERTLDVTVPHGRDKVMDLINEICPDDAECIEKLYMAYEDMVSGLNYWGSARGNPDPEVLKKEHSNFMRLMTMSAGDLFRALGMSDKLIDILSAYWPYQGTEINTIDASRYILMICSFLRTILFTYDGDVPMFSAIFACVVAFSIHLIFTSISILFFSILFPAGHLNYLIYNSIQYSTKPSF